MWPGPSSRHNNLTLHPRLQMLAQQLATTPLQRIDDAEFRQRQVELWIKRDDLLHMVISGNKWRKLKYILDDVLHSGSDSIVSMGGCYSNHLHALAFAGQALGLNTAALVRGEEPAQFNPTLADLRGWGMSLRFISRDAYRQLRHYKTPDSLPGLTAGEYWLPEGGACGLALQGVAEIIREIDMSYDVLAVACGTGTTLAGLISQAPVSSRVLGVAALKNAGFLVADVQAMLAEQGIYRDSWQVLLDYHFGGFGKTSPDLLAFMRQFQAEHDIALEPIYTGKLLFALYDLLKQGYFSAGQRIVVLHTGGLQGWRI